MKKHTLTIRGYIIYCANKATNSAEKTFDWKNAIIDATITSGLTFFSTLGGTTIVGHVAITNAIISSVMAASTQFLVFLSLKRGLGSNHK